MASTKYIFSGHESFSCKSLWPKKGYDFVKSGYQFSSAESVMILGVGKNMVSSIRFWIKALGLINSSGNITQLADYLFDDAVGKDKYVEDLGTLWLLHFNLVNNLEATLYDWIFRGMQKERKLFSRDAAVSYVKRRFAEEGKQNLFNINTIKKDVSVLLQSYTLPQKPKSNEDYSLLLMDLDLIRQSKDSKDYYFNIEGKRKISCEIFLYAILAIKGEDDTLPFEKIQEKVGLAFCMNDMETIVILQTLSSRYPDYLQYSDVAGIRQLQFTKSLDAFKVLDDYYGTDI